jgi:hypothetical protein
VNGNFIIIVIVNYFNAIFNNKFVNAYIVCNLLTSCRQVYDYGHAVWHTGGNFW